jgi:uncharacterized protein YqeY
MEITKDKILSKIEEKIESAKKEKIRILGMDKNHPALPSVDARINSLVLIKSELIRENKNNNEYHLSNSEEIVLLNSMAEKRKQNVKDYSNNGRQELAEAEQKELEIINEFLPKMPTEDEIKQFISDKIDEYLVSKDGDYKLSMRDMGEIKKLVNSTYPTVNGGVIKDVLMSKI